MHKLDKTEGGKNSQLFIKIYALYRDSIQIIIYIDGNLIKLYIYILLKSYRTTD